MRFESCILGSLACFLIACASPRPAPLTARISAPVHAAAEVAPLPVADAPDWLDRIDDAAPWALLAAPSDEHAFARTEAVKALWDQVTDRF